MNTQTVSQALARGSDDNYLGSQVVVNRLLAEMLAAWTRALASRDKARIKDDFEALSTKYGDIFSGKDPGYQIIQGYNDFSLASKLRADLGRFWIDHQNEYDQQPVRCLMGYLMVMYYQISKKHQHDDILVSGEFNPILSAAISLCLGTEKRVGM